MKKCMVCGKAIKKGFELCYFCFENTRVSPNVLPDPIESGKFMKQMGISMY